jgi:hypothetical protein
MMLRSENNGFNVSLEAGREAGVNGQKLIHEMKNEKEK